MAIQVSPGVNVTEYDATTTVPAISTTSGAIAGVFRWGPVGQLVLVDSETTLVKRFGKPTNLNAETFFTAANFLSYGNSLYVSRAANTTDTTTDGYGTFSAIADNSGTIAANVSGNTYWGANVNASFFITNQTVYNNTAPNASNGQFGATFGANASYYYAAKYPGAIGNSLTITTCDSAAAFSSNLVNVSNVNFGSFGVNATSGAPLANSSTFFNKTTAVLAFPDANTAAILNNYTSNSNLYSYAAYTALTVGDYIAFGNSTTGTQTLQLTSKGPQPTVASFAGTVASTNNTITSISNTASIVVGSLISVNTAAFGGSSSSPVLVSVTSIVNASAITVNTNSTASGSVTGQIAQTFLNLTFASPYTVSTAPGVTGGNVGRLWQYYGAVTSAPGVSYYQQNFGGTANTVTDQIHAVVVDTLGKFTGVPGQVLEVFQGMSRATDSKTADGSSNFFVNILNQNSNFVWVTNVPSSTTNYITTATSMVSVGNTAPTTIAFAGGQDGFSESNVGTNIGAITAAYDLYKSTERAAISLIMAGKSDDTNGTVLGNYLIQNIAQPRMDCIVFVSPSAKSVVNQVGSELANIQTFRAGLTASSYGVLDSGYKYMYDRYNDVYRYVPLNGDIAGLCVYTDVTKDPWWSPAGFNRGQIKNIVKLSYNPTKSDRDILYPLSVNPVVTFPGQGTILYGDKTLSNPSAFDRINVRRLFIILEKTIARAAQNMLFEFNDSFTQTQFVSLVTPFLKQVQGRRGITDFKVICDSTNNTPAVVDANQFVGDIYIKPARAINFIQLNFVAVRTGVSFSEIIGQF